MFLFKMFLSRINTSVLNVSFQLFFFLFLGFIPHLVSSSEKPTELVILNWSEYMNTEMIKAFENEFNVRVKEVYFESDDARDQILLQTDGKGFDLILVNGITIDAYRKRGWLQTIPVADIPNLKYIQTRWQNAFESSGDYGVAYFWGTLGIAYRKDLVKQPITSWKQLYQPDKELQGKIIMVKSSRDIIGMALKALGFSSDSENIDELVQAEQLLMAQKPYVSRYGYITLEEDSSMVKGDIVASTIYGGDALNVAEYNNNIVFVLPEEGGNIWVDYFSISKASKQPKLAAAFINFINQPEWTAKNAEEMYLATPNSEAKKLLSPEQLNDPVIYPDASLLNRSGFHKVLSPKASRMRAQIFSRVVQ